MHFLFMYGSEHPRAFRNASTNDFSVIWKSNAKAWVTRELFEDWFLNYFCPACTVKIKILIAAWQCPWSSPNLGELNENVNVLYFPHNTTSLIQSMNQGVIATLKAFYTNVRSSNSSYNRKKFEHVITWILEKIWYWKGSRKYKWIMEGSYQ